MKKNLSSQRNALPFKSDVENASFYTISTQKKWRKSPKTTKIFFQFFFVLKPKNWRKHIWSRIEFYNMWYVYHIAISLSELFPSQSIFYIWVFCFGETRSENSQNSNNFKNFRFVRIRWSRWVLSGGSFGANVSLRSFCAEWPQFNGGFVQYNTSISSKISHLKGTWAQIMQ